MYQVQCADQSSSLRWGEVLLLSTLSLPSSPGAAGEAVARAVTLEEGPGQEVLRLVSFSKLQFFWKLSPQEVQFLSDFSPHRDWSDNTVLEGTVL